MREKWPDRYPPTKPRKPSQYDVAKLAGVKQPSVHKWTRGGPIDGQVMAGMAVKLGVSTEWLTTGRGEKFPLQALDPLRSELLRVLSTMDEVGVMEVVSYAQYLAKQRGRQAG
jgi:hypothetical protein